MKVYDLQCEQSHVFEGWFGSEEDYEQQQKRGLLSCPLCGSTQILRKLSAPRLNVSNLREPAAARGAVAEQKSVGPEASSSQEQNADVSSLPPEQLKAVQAKVLQQMRQWISASDDVGNQFADEARRMHRGEIPERPIRGETTAEEREALRDEGVPVMPIPDFLSPDRSLN